MSCGNRSSGREPIGAVRRQRQNIDAGRGDRDIAAAIGHFENVVGAVGCGHGDDIGIGRRIERLGLRPGIAGGRDQHHAFVIGRSEQAPQRRIRWARKAHIDNARAVVRRPLQAFIDRKRGALGDTGGVVKGVRRQNLRTRRDAQKLAMRGDGAGHFGAMQMRSFTAAERVEAFYDGAIEIRVLGVDLGVDHREQHVLSRCELMRLRDLQFGKNILCRIALHSCGGGLVLQRENVVRLHAGDDVLVAERVDDARHRTAAADTPAIKAHADQRKVLGFDLREVVAARELIDRLRRRVRCKRGDHFVGDKGLVALRHRRRAAAVIAIAVVAAVRGVAAAIAATAVADDATAADNRRMRRAPAGRPPRIAAAEARRWMPPYRRAHRTPNGPRKSATTETEQAKRMCRARCADAARGQDQGEEQQSQRRTQTP